MRFRDPGVESSMDIVTTRVHSLTVYSEKGASTGSSFI